MAGNGRWSILLQPLRDGCLLRMHRMVLILTVVLNVERILPSISASSMRGCARTSGISGSSRSVSVCVSGAVIRLYRAWFQEDGFSSGVCVAHWFDHYVSMSPEENVTTNTESLTKRALEKVRYKFSCYVLFGMQGNNSA
ncbi:hypothetical protein GQ600_20469 [Phytophthora cactorum]|nr:hypothetical protein GQ600_20469 [Phytophthora cactorum]